MASEREWVETIRSELEKAIRDQRLAIETQRRLSYASNVVTYRGSLESPNLDDPTPPANHGYHTDLLISERVVAGESPEWAPRVVVEFKFSSVTTHDALTYSAKAATHRSLHPYLRYGIIVGNYDGPVPKRLIRHGQQFDFMMTLGSDQLTPPERKQVIDLLSGEIEASRMLSKLAAEKSNVRLLHRRLCIHSEHGVSN
ncbi:hypothetical protein [Dongia deserti]|uniref:hypothetical protein n=1 Tax=Dongia deserti TaxID=2268030 RepID=UPI0013C4A94C|nr:hypothetical protein [Dongia deserti]